MQKLSNFAGQARHGWEKMPPAFGMGRPHDGQQPGPGQQQQQQQHQVGPSLPGQGPQHQHQQQQQQHHPHPHPQHPHQHQHMKRGAGLPAGGPLSPHPSPFDSIVTLSFNVPFSSNLAGPLPDEILHASPGAAQRWTFPEGTDPINTPSYKLPVHIRNEDLLRQLCKALSDSSGGRLEAAVTASEPKPTPASQRLPRKGLVTNVCVSGEGDMVHKMRAKILNETPIALKCAVVEVDTKYVLDINMDRIRPNVLEHMNIISKYTGADIFLLRARAADPDNLCASYASGTDQSLDQRLRISIYGDPESSEHAKLRVLIMIDQILKREVDMMKLEMSLHTIICGRTRKNVRLIEAATNTAIYFPPPFPQVYGYIPPGAHRRGPDEVYITGEKQDNMTQAKKKLAELVINTKCYVKEIAVLPHKIDCILLDRLDKVRKVMETNGTYILFPPLGSQRGIVRVQGTDILHVERTIREIMALAGQFYSATWWILHQDLAPATTRLPSPADTRAMLSDICANSGADLAFEKFSFSINGSDDAVKAAMVVIHQIPFVKRAQYQIRVKIELANEHKEFVSGKKNGKINKIMGQSNVQIIFDGFNEYNFYIDVCGGQYEAVKNGLDLVEQEMPASISFHVPDQYHKRIIGIGGQHIQRIMKKYSVFVKFSNAMDRGGIGKDDEDIKVDNVICRTPARNAQSLDLVKQEIMDMVEKADAEFVSETVVINRLYHRELISRMSKIEELEKKWNCKIDFPSTEMASDVVTISGPEYQVPQALDEFLGMVPEEHELVLPGTPSLRTFFKSPDFDTEIRHKLHAQYEVYLILRDDAVPVEGEADVTEERLVLQYTRNNAGGLKDAIDFVVARLVPHGLDEATVKGAIPRPKSDSFENSLPFFNSKLLQHAPPPLVTDSPTRSTFGDDISDRSSLFDKLRKPGSISSISSFLDRRKNNHSSSSNSLFKHASSNASKASLVSMESRDSGYRNPWGDSTMSLVGGGLGGEEQDVAGSVASTGTAGSSHTSILTGQPLISTPGSNASGSMSAWPGPVTMTSRSFHEPQSAILFGGSGAGASAGAGTTMTVAAGDSTPKHHDRPSTGHSLNGFGLGAGLGVGTGQGASGTPGLGPIGTQQQQQQGPSAGHVGSLGQGQGQGQGQGGNGLGAIGPPSQSQGRPGK